VSSSGTRPAAAGPRLTGTRLTAPGLLPLWYRTLPSRYQTVIMLLLPSRYQMVIMFLLGATSTAGAVASTCAAVFPCWDGCHRLRLERLTTRSRRSGVNGAIAEGAALGECWSALLVSAGQATALAAVAERLLRAPLAS